MDNHGLREEYKLIQTNPSLIKVEAEAEPSFKIDRVKCDILVDDGYFDGFFEGYSFHSLEDFEDNKEDIISQLT